MGRIHYKAVVIGISAGGTKALRQILPKLPGNFPLPIIIIQHMGVQSDGYFIDFLNQRCKLRVVEANEKEKIKPGYIYFPPPNYHLLVEADETFSLSLEGRVNYARPSIDVLFESAAYVYRTGLIGIIMTGANGDGSLGLKKIQEMGGCVWVQNPETAEVDSMPSAAVQQTHPDEIINLEEIIPLLVKTCLTATSKDQTKTPEINDPRGLLVIDK